jgi:hypothetical protein
MKVFTEEHAQIYNLGYKLCKTLADDGIEVSLTTEPEEASILIGNPQLIPFLREWHRQLFGGSSFKWPIKEKNVGVIIYANGVFSICGPTPAKIKAAVEAFMNTYHSIIKTMNDNKPISEHTECQPYIVIIKDDGSYWFERIERKK